jgi:hypothetical protein
VVFALVSLTNCLARIEALTVTREVMSSQLIKVSRIKPTLRRGESFMYEYLRENTGRDGHTRDTSLVSGRSGVTLPARVLQAGFFNKTWSAWQRETSPGNAKQEIRISHAYRLRGVAYNGSHRWSKEAWETAYMAREDGCLCQYTKRRKLATSFIPRTRSHNTKNNVTLSK